MIDLTFSVLTVVVLYRSIDEFNRLLMPTFLVEVPQKLSNKNQEMIDGIF
ncbi:hypothetical protein NIES37_73100 (plasmid) [Tolypothrix tenuis PCC 7101]|uniref:Uncharacterized protein n=1 Tax=Tolypothrix tenuis PCC 7101 TaxID=231146 RepID=A0A1Z4NC47_9CYAN|nr:hypothetical protein NIES37_73100 [Tolypothrix tenuis PCC 7101]BAZ78648.1 hypothetical protein NIES50_72810 [Aulosira laxa NIES-50]